ncbi:hypothetical protein CHARACLAT_033446 [Characodon lateralis]|uniref:Uncharacterized protein n=1 Tax=Characodon lateralis TaxID=208331 RepID=A0ABU7F839_9TELE|nr:hypothetical protein [Characodon lateralis]
MNNRIYHITANRNQNYMGPAANLPSCFHKYSTASRKNTSKKTIQHISGCKTTRTRTIGSFQYSSSPPKCSHSFLKPLQRSGFRSMRSTRCYLVTLFHQVLSQFWFLNSPTIPDSDRSGLQAYPPLPQPLECCFP